MMAILHGRKSQMNHLVSQHPVVLESLQGGVLSHSDENQPAARGIGHSMADSAASAGANAQGKAWNRKASIVAGHGRGRALDPAQKVAGGEIERFVGKSDFNRTAGNLQHSGRWSSLGAKRRGRRQEHQRQGKRNPGPAKETS